VHQVAQRADPGGLTPYQRLIAAGLGLK